MRPCLPSTADRVRLFEIVFFLSCAAPALTIYTLRLRWGAKHESWTLAVVIALTAAALGFGAHAAGVQIDRSL